MRSVMTMLFMLSVLASSPVLPATAGERLIMCPPTRASKVEKPKTAAKEEFKRTARQAVGSPDATVRKVVGGRIHEARTDARVVEVSPRCVIDASKRFRIPVSVLLAVMDVEGGTVGAREGNRNGTWDMGPMQVNTCHLPEVAGFGITRDDIENNGCINVHVAAWILRNHLNATGGDILESVGRYHSRNQPHKARYQMRAAEAYRAIRANPGKHVSRILGRANSGRI